jgi:hypothetical protein
MGGTVRAAGGNASSHGKRVCRQGQTAGQAKARKRIAEGTLLLGDLGFADIRKESRMGRATGEKVLASLQEAQVSIDRQPHFACIGILLAVVFPPANRA